MIPNFIDDGYEAKGYLAESEDFNHGEFRFWYRTLSPVERDSLARELNETRPGFRVKEAWDVSYKLLERQIIRWESPMPLNQSSLRRMNFNLIPRIRNIVLGYLASDRDPQDGADAPEPKPDTHLVEADAKNSVAG